jgi:sugar lactone lactonase YvrE
MKSLITLAVCCLLFLAACDEGLVGGDAATLAGSEAVSTSSLGKKPAGSPGAAGRQLAAGEAEIFHSFPTDGLMNKPEGIAFDRRGNMYVSNRIGTDDNWNHNTIEVFSPKGDQYVLADLGSSCAGFSGLLGLTTGPMGNVYAAFGSCTALNGVVIVDRAGNVEHIDGSEVMGFPNAMSFDANGNLYVTDSFAGMLFRLDRKTGQFGPWMTDASLDPDFTSAVPYGANGIAFKAPNHLYIANTAKGHVVQVDILNDGSPGMPHLILPTGPMAYLFIYPDGLSIDTHGVLYAAIPPAGTPPPPGVPAPPGGFPPMSPVVSLDPASGYASPVVAPHLPGGPGSELFDTVTSLAFGSGPFDRKSLFVVSGDLFNTPIGSGPVVTQVGAGVPGAMGQ